MNRKIRYCMRGAIVISILNSVIPIGANRIPDTTTIIPKRVRRNKKRIARLIAEITLIKVKATIIRSESPESITPNRALNDTTKLTHNAIS